MKPPRALILACLLAALASPPAAMAGNEFVGIVANDTFAGDEGYRNVAFGDQASLGIGMIRQTFTWASIEGRSGYHFGYYDDYVASAARHGIRVLPVLFDPPKFRSSKPRKHAKHGTYFPKRAKDMGKFGAAVAKRYGPNGTLWSERPDIPKLPFTAYQIWNEPNLAAYAPPKPNAKKYVALLRTTGRAIKKVDRSAEIVTAGLPDSRLSKPNLYKYIAKMYKAKARGTFDTLGINPYAPTAKSMIGKLRKVRRIMKKYHDAKSSIWLTEIGWSDVGPKAPFRVGASGQAKRIKDTIAALKAQQTALKIRGFFYFSWTDAPPYAGHGDFWGLHTGLLRKDGTHKPAFDAFQQAVAGL
jgi:polysaccharide biosynthesis protein PslG